MAITRRKFTLEFRTEAAHRVIDTGRSVRAVASELSIEENTLSKWVRDERRRMEALRRVSSLLRQFLNQFSELATSFTG